MPATDPSNRLLQQYGKLSALPFGKTLFSLAAGTMMEASLPRTHRWIPKDSHVGLAQADDRAEVRLASRALPLKALRWSRC